LKAQGYADSTLKAMDRRLRQLARHTDIEGPKAVKRWISERTWSSGYKGNVVNHYDLYCKFYGIEWKKPYYERVDKIQRIARTEDINKIIAHARLKYAVCYSIMRDTGIRPIEAFWLRLRNIDRNNAILYPESAKHGKARVLPLKPSTVAMINRYVTKHNITENDHLFNSLKQIKDNWMRIRKRVAEKLGEPGLMSIKLYGLRHHFATLLYAKTKDILFVQRQLGHKNIVNTLRYVGLIDFDKQTYIVKIAQNVEESAKLLEQAFEYVGPIEGSHVFRKPKLPSFLYRFLRLMGIISDCFQFLICVF